MSRKRKPTDKEPPADTSTATTEPPAPTKDIEPPANDSQPSFVERVVQRRGIATPDPFSIAGDYLAGVRLFESRQDRQVAIKFGEGRPEDKPSQEVIDKLKEAGFRWNPNDRIWAHPVWPASAMSTRIRAEKVYQEVCQMIRKEKNVAPEQDIPF
jgi:hypothetical protein